MKTTLLLAASAAFLLALGIFIGRGQMVGEEIDFVDAELGEARFLELVARGRIRTLERDLGLCEAESVYITVVTSSEDAEGVYMKAIGGGK